MMDRDVAREHRSGSEGLAVQTTRVAHAVAAAHFEERAASAAAAEVHRSHSCAAYHAWVEACSHGAEAHRVVQADDHEIVQVPVLSDDGNHLAVHVAGRNLAVVAAVDHADTAALVRLVVGEGAQDSAAEGHHEVA